MTNLIETNVKSNTKVHYRQLELFTEAIPKYTYCTDNLAQGIYRVQKEFALQKKYIAPNGKTHVHYFVFDIDNEDAHSPYYWEDRKAPPPNISVINQENGHAHYFYGLTVPMLRTPEASQKAFRYGASIENALVKKLEGDFGYAGLIAKNPLNKAWEIKTYQEHLYDFDCLADYLVLEKDKRKHLLDYGLGRNCTLFDRLKRYAYTQVRHCKKNNKSYDQFLYIINNQAIIYNDFQTPLPMAEVKATVKSICKWTWQHFTYDDFIEWQKRSNQRSQEVRKAKAEERKQGLLDLDFSMCNLSTREASKILGVSNATISRYRNQKNPII